MVIRHKIKLVVYYLSKTVIFALANNDAWVLKQKQKNNMSPFVRRGDIKIPVFQLALSNIVF